MKADEPSFRAADQLARYIRPEHRQGKRRPKVSAFLEDETGSTNGLSVNSVEVQSVGEIAEVYSRKFAEERPIAMSVHTVEQYNTAADEVSVSVRQYSDGHWVHSGKSGPERSYKHDPKDQDLSHTLVRFTVMFNDGQAFRFARRMAYKPTYDLL